MLLNLTPLGSLHPTLLNFVFIFSLLVPRMRVSLTSGSTLNPQSDLALLSFELKKVSPWAIFEHSSFH